MTAKDWRLKIHQGNRLEQLLSAMDISVTELYRRTNISRNTIVAKIKAESIEEKYILAFSEALGIEPAYFAGTDNPDHFAAISLTSAHEKITTLTATVDDLKGQNELLRNQLSINARYIDQLEKQNAARVSSELEKDEKEPKRGS